MKNHAESGQVENGKPTRKGVPPAELQRLYVLAQRVYRAFPAITESQMREFFAADSTIRQESFTMFKQLTARGTTLSEYAGISLVNDVAIDMQQNSYTEDEEMEKLSELRAQLDLLAQRAREEKRVKDGQEGGSNAGSNAKAGSHAGSNQKSKK